MFDYILLSLWHHCSRYMYVLCHTDSQNPNCVNWAVMSLSVCHQSLCSNDWWHTNHPGIHAAKGLLIADIFNNPVKLMLLLSWDWVTKLVSRVWNNWLVYYTSRGGILVAELACTDAARGRLVTLSWYISITSCKNTRILWKWKSIYMLNRPLHNQSFRYFCQNYIILNINTTYCNWCQVI